MKIARYALLLAIVAAIAGCSSDSKPDEIKAPKPAAAPGRPGSTTPTN